MRSEVVIGLVHRTIFWACSYEICLRVGNLPRPAWLLVLSSSDVDLSGFYPETDSLRSNTPASRLRTTASGVYVEGWGLSCTAMYMYMYPPNTPSWWVYCTVTKASTSIPRKENKYA